MTLSWKCFKICKACDSKLKKKHMVSDILHVSKLEPYIFEILANFVDTGRNK